MHSSEYSGHYVAMPGPWSMDIVSEWSGERREMSFVKIVDPSSSVETTLFCSERKVFVSRPVGSSRHVRAFDYFPFSGVMTGIEAETDSASFVGMLRRWLT